MHRQFPGSVAIKEAFKSWSDKAMRFSFKAKKGLIGATISGVIQVNEDSVVMDSDLPGLVTAFVSEDTIRNMINDTAGRLISGLSQSRFATFHWQFARRHFPSGVEMSVPGGGANSNIDAGTGPCV